MTDYLAIPFLQSKYIPCQYLPVILGSDAYFSAACFWCLRCNSDVSFPILGYLNRAINFLGDGRLGGGAPPPLNTPLTYGVIVGDNTRVVL